MFYVVENGNLQKKVQPYAADRIYRFQSPPALALTQNLGPGAYHPQRSGGLLPNLVEPPPVAKTKKKLQQTAQQWSKTAQSVPSIPTGNKMLLMSAEDDADDQTQPLEAAA